MPYHLQEDVKNELKRLKEPGHLERLETIEEDCFVSPVLITVKKDKSVKIALYARKLSESCIKKRPHVPKMDDLLNQISAELSKNDTDPIWIAVVDLDYACGQMKLARLKQAIIATLQLQGRILTDTTNSERNSTARQTHPQYFKRK